MRTICHGRNSIRTTIENSLFHLRSHAFLGDGNKEVFVSRDADYGDMEKYIAVFKCYIDSLKFSEYR